MLLGTAINAVVAGTMSGKLVVVGVVEAGAGAGAMRVFSMGTVAWTGA